FARGRARADAQGRGDDGAGSEESIVANPPRSAAPRRVLLSSTQNKHQLSLVKSQRSGGLGLIPREDAGLLWPGFLIDRRTLHRPPRCLNRLLQPPVPTIPPP